MMRWDICRLKTVPFFLFPIYYNVNDVKITAFATHFHFQTLYNLLLMFDPIVSGLDLQLHYDSNKLLTWDFVSIYNVLPQQSLWDWKYFLKNQLFSCLSTQIRGLSIARLKTQDTEPLRAQRSLLWMMFKRANKTREPSDRQKQTQGR